MGNKAPIPAHWEPLISSGKKLTRTEGIVYHRIQRGYIDKNTRKLLLLPRLYGRDNLAYHFSKCEFCESRVKYDMLDRTCHIIASVCKICKMKIDRKFYHCGIAYTYDDNYLSVGGYGYFMITRFSDISTGLCLVPNKYGNCSLCGSKPIEYNICRKCRQVLIKFMLKRVILLKEYLIDDILTCVVKAIAG